MLEDKLIIIPALGHQNKGKSNFTGSGLFVLMFTFALALLRWPLVFLIFNLFPLLAGLSCKAFDFTNKFTDISLTLKKIKEFS